MQGRALESLATGRLGPVARLSACPCWYLNHFLRCKTVLPGCGLVAAPPPGMRLDRTCMASPTGGAWAVQLPSDPPWDGDHPQRGREEVEAESSEVVDVQTPVQGKQVIASTLQGTQASWGPLCRVDLAHPGPLTPCGTSPLTNLGFSGTLSALGRW